jgi:hypothetical protein
MRATIPFPRIVRGVQIAALLQCIRCNVVGLILSGNRCDTEADADLDIA